MHTDLAGAPTQKSNNRDVRSELWLVDSEFECACVTLAAAYAAQTGPNAISSTIAAAPALSTISGICCSIHNHVFICIMPFAIPSEIEKSNHCNPMGWSANKAGVACSTSSHSQLWGVSHLVPSNHNGVLRVVDHDRGVDPRQPSNPNNGGNTITEPAPSVCLTVSNNSGKKFTLKQISVRKSRKVRDSNIQTTWFESKSLHRIHNPPPHSQYSGLCVGDLYIHMVIQTDGSQARQIWLRDEHEWQSIQEKHLHMDLGGKERYLVFTKAAGVPSWVDKRTMRKLYNTM